VLKLVEPYFENYPNRFDYGLMLSMRARVLVDGGETTQAIEACRVAFEIEKECSGRHKLEIRAELFETLGLCRQYLGEHDQADGNFAQAVLAHLAIDDWDEAHRVAQHIRSNIEPNLPLESEPFIVGTYI
jgi:tetratricopeptide (TPR) repeat protein